MYISATRATMTTAATATTATVDTATITPCPFSCRLAVKRSAEKPNRGDGKERKSNISAHDRQPARLEGFAPDLVATAR